MLSRGSRIHDDYEVWGLLGEGGMSEVWLAKHTVLCVPVVIKTLRKAIAEAAGEAGAKRMFNEARLMARVANPRVVRAIDAGIDDGTPYLVQEYVDGIDMAELDAQRRKAFGVGLPLWLVCHVMAETCEALHAAHQAGVIHRDVKPSNLFAAPESGIRLGDFGIAVARAEAPTSEVSGTIKFMAPEQLRGQEIDRTTDVYGAGATAYDLRYGHAPYAALDEVLDDARVASFPAPQFPAEAYFQQLLRMMLSKNRANRPADLAEPGRHFALLARALRGDGGHAHHSLVCPTKHEFHLAGCEIVLRVGDVAKESADAIVSSAGYEMKMRSGSSDALRVVGGDDIEHEAMSGGVRALGSCVVTGAGKLKAKRVIHAVSAWNETSCIGRAMFRALLFAEQLGLKTLAIPALGTGASRVSFETCASAMMTALRWHLTLGGSRLHRVTVVLGDEKKLKTYRDVAEEALERRLRILLRVREDAATRVIHARLRLRAPRIGENAELDRLEARRARELRRDVLIDRRAAERSAVRIAGEHAVHTRLVVVEADEVDPFAHHDVALDRGERLGDAAGREGERRAGALRPIAARDRPVRREEEEEPLRDAARRRARDTPARDVVQQRPAQHRQAEPHAQLASRQLHVD